MNKQAQDQGDPRQAIYQSAQASRDAQLAEDGAVEVQGDEWEDEPAGTPEPEKEPEKEPELKEEPAPERMVKVKVYGVEKEVPESEVVARYQMTEAADQRLEEAKRLFQEAKAEREAARKPEEKKPEPLPQDLAQAMREIAKRQMNAESEEQFADLEVEKEIIREEAYRRRRTAEQQREQEVRALEDFRRGTEEFLGKVKAQHSDFDRYVKVDLAKLGQPDAVVIQPEFQSWLSTQQPWMLNALRSEDPSGPIYVVGEFKKSKQAPDPGFAEREKQKQKLDNVKGTGQRAVKAEEEEDDSPRSYVQKLQRMRGRAL